MWGLFFLLVLAGVVYEVSHGIKLKASSVIDVDEFARMMSYDGESISEELNDCLYVMVDAGHGGKDPGANYGDVYEKDITLSVAKKVAAMLETYQIQVIMTREDDTFIDVYERAKMANAEDVDIFISIHVNDLKQTSHSGIETYAGHWKREGNLLAHCVHEETLKIVDANDLGVYFADYVVVKYTKMASALIEIGYMSNKEERTKLQSNAYQQMLAEGIVNGILAYAEKYIE